MAEEEKDHQSNVADEQPVEQRGKISPELLGYIFEPSDERLPELTDLPLNQINTLSWMTVYDEQTRMMARAAQYAIDKKNGNKAVKPEPMLLSEVYRKAYYQHRRSLEGSGKMMASTLAMKQLEMQATTEEEDQLFPRRQ